MSDEPTICAKCEHGFVSSPNLNPHMSIENAFCRAKAKPGVDFISGKEIMDGVVMCLKKNLDGDCKDFEKREGQKWAADDVKSGYLVRSDDPDDYCSICDHPTQRRWITNKVLGCINAKCVNYYRRGKV